MQHLFSTNLNHQACNNLGIAIKPLVLVPVKAQNIKDMKRLIVITGFIFIVALTSVAQTHTPRVNTRQKAQRVRIAEGRKEGSITNKEAAVLNHQQRHIRRSERRAKADGVVTPAERLRLEHKQDRASRTIHRAKHNPVEKQK